MNENDESNQSNQSSNEDSLDGTVHSSPRSTEVHANSTSIPLVKIELRFTSVAKYDAHVKTIFFAFTLFRAR